MFQKLGYFLNDAKREFRRINWPTAHETARLTMVVIAISLLFTIFLGAFDLLFLVGMENVL